MIVWILQTGEPLHIDRGKPRPMRAMNLSEKLVSAGHRVVLWSSAFDHQNKTHRSTDYKVYNISENLEIRLIPSCGYRRHIGFRRLFDHAQMAWNLNKLLKLEEAIPDVAFVGYPPVESASVMSKWLKRRNVPTLLDIKDLWPSVFVDAFPRALQPFAKTFLYPYFYLAKRTMADANGISTMSQSFLNWSLSFAGKLPSKSDRIVRLTAPDIKNNNGQLNAADQWWKKNNVNPDDNTPKIFFTGTFSSAFDFDQIYTAAKEVTTCQFVLCGHGPYLNKVKELMKDLTNVTFPGWIDKSQMESLANMSIASLAPYKNFENFTLNIPNKIVDSLSLGSPILSPLEGEVSALIKANMVGLTYGRNRSLSDCIKLLLDNNELQEQMSINAKNTYKEKFEFDKVYDGLVSHLEKLTHID